MTLGDAIADASELLTAAAERAARFVATGIILQ
jgi:hypothetical protein